MTTPQAEAEALLPWTEQHLQSALINLIEAAKNSVRGPERGGSENAVSGIYQQIVAAWNTRAQLDKPSVAPDDEALIRLRAENAKMRDAIEGILHDDSAQVSLADQRRRWTARMEAAASAIGTDDDHWFLFYNPDTGAEVAQSHPIKSGECDDAERIQRIPQAVAEELRDAWSRAEAAEAALAACRNKTIEECAAVARSYEPRCDTCPSGVENAIHALKTKENGNG